MAILGIIRKIIFLPILLLIFLVLLTLAVIETKIGKYEDE